MATSFGKDVLNYFYTLDPKLVLPAGITLLHPFQSQNANLKRVITQFYEHYYGDNNGRHLILGINPGRLGAGVTGIPFTDTKRLTSVLQIPFEDAHTHEPSSVFVYQMIEAYGGPEAFYQDFMINSVCPLGFTIQKENGKEVNCNYYDFKPLAQAVYPLAVQNIKAMLDIGCKTDVCFCFGTNKNYHYLAQLDTQEKFFNKIVPLEHPRYIMQYKSKDINKYIDVYLNAFSQIK